MKPGLTEAAPAPRRTQDYLRVFAKGLAMGAADSVPGVSGGTIAVVTRIYDELIDSLRSFDLMALRQLFSGAPMAAWKHVNGTFLLVLFCGILLSLRLSAGLVLILLEDWFEPLMAFFIGLVCAASMALTEEFGGWNWRVALLMLAGIGLTLIVSGLSPYTSELSYGYLFLCGMVAICAMILPGLSGAFLLLVLGAYDYVLGALVEFDIVTIAVFVSGCGIGLLSFSRLLFWTLHRYRQFSYAFLTGMLIGSIWALWPWQRVVQTYLDRDGEQHVLEAVNVLPVNYQALTGQDPQYLLVATSFIVGVIIIFGFEQLFRKSVD